MNAPLIALLVAGVALDVVGVVLASRPRLHRWKAHGDGRALRSYVAEPLTSWISTRIHGVRKLLPWRRTPEVVELEVHDTLQVQVTTEIKLQVGLSAEAEVWPSLTTDPDAFAVKMFERFREVDARRRANENATADVQRAYAELERELSSKITRDVGRANAEIQDLAVGGLRQEVVGLCLIVLGSVMALVAGILLAA